MRDTKLKDAAPSEVVRAYFGAYASGNRPAVERLLADNST